MGLGTSTGAADGREATLPELEAKWKRYHGERDFARGRARMVRDGWVIAEEQLLPGKSSLWADTGSVADYLFVPILWLFNKSQPAEIRHVKWVRPRE